MLRMIQIIYTSAIKKIQIIHMATMKKAMYASFLNYIILLYFILLC